MSPFTKWGYTPYAPMGALYSVKLKFYALSMRKFLSSVVVLNALIFSTIAPNPASAKPEVKRHSSCSQLRKVWSKGVATSLARARLQAVRPTVSAVGYAKNRHLDNDRDGTACEVSAPKSSQPKAVITPGVTNSPGVANTPNVVSTIAKQVCPTGSWKFELTGFRVTMTLPTLNPAISNYYFETVGTFTNSTNAIVFPNSMSAKVAFTPNTNNWTRVYPTSPASFSLLLNGASFEVAPGASALVSGTGVLESLSTPTLAGSDVKVMWNDPRNVAFCPEPVRG
jgi:hypothetical protein